jgi:hypothetical protein
MSIMQNTIKRLGVWAILIAVILVIPLLTKAPWTGSDFIFGAVILFGAAVVYELITRNMNNRRNRVIAGFAVFLVLSFVWVGAATGFEGVFDRLEQLQSR